MFTLIIKDLLKCSKDSWLVMWRTNMLSYKLLWILQQWYPVCKPLFLYYRERSVETMQHLHPGWEFTACGFFCLCTLINKKWTTCKLRCQRAHEQCKYMNNTLCFPLTDYGCLKVKHLSFVWILKVDESIMMLCIELVGEFFLRNQQT